MIGAPSDLSGNKSKGEKINPAPVIKLFKELQLKEDSPAKNELMRPLEDQVSMKGNKGDEIAKYASDVELISATNKLDAKFKLSIIEVG